MGGTALALDCVHDLVALAEDGVAEGAGPLDVSGHGVEYGGRAGGQGRLDPEEVVGTDGTGEGVAGEARVLLGPRGGVSDLVPVG